MPRPPQPGTHRHRVPEQLLAELFHAAVDAVEPEAALTRAFAEDPPPPAERVWIIASGKASAAMTSAAVHDDRAGERAQPTSFDPHVHSRAPSAGTGVAGRRTGAGGPDGPDPPQ